ncbi:hypothetical protein Mal48_11970 [Thalassoglobus polymorphus]|uniref:Uncharacterized protein n=1 Tax=Thalassoglobus polymorphus TaxID=2527994 RepID=A0A517QJZ8_9PLAN|nr:hypothetical protein Mal48_11970 [Thalassoglobus polymorphus]
MQYLPSDRNELFPQCTSDKSTKQERIFELDSMPTPLAFQTFRISHTIRTFPVGIENSVVRQLKAKFIDCISSRGGMHSKQVAD